MDDLKKLIKYAKKVKNKSANKATEKRNIKAFMMRSEGKTYREIAEEIGVSKHRADQIVKHIKRQAMWIELMDTKKADQ